MRTAPAALQQSNTVTGTVLDPNGDPIIGATVEEVGTTRKTITDVDGHFTLTGTKPGAELEISYIGYKTVRVKAADGLSLNLQEDVAMLDEVVAVGYGTVKKSDLTGSVSSITAREFMDQPASVATSILAGRAAGVTVRKNSGAPGQGSVIRVRGANSVYGSNDPLIVVDGNYGSMPNNYEIESIEVLKDASATAIYGSRGANGVIIVTTKAGRRDTRPRVEFHSDFSITDQHKRFDLMDAYEYAVASNEVGSYTYTQDQLNSYKNGVGTDWQDEMFRTGFNQSYNLEISGGGKNFTYYFAPHYSHDTGTIITTHSQTYSIDSKMTFNIGKRVTVRFTGNMNHWDNMNANMAGKTSKTSNALLAAAVWAPTEPVYEDDGVTYNQMAPQTGTLLSPVFMAEGEKNKQFGNSWTAIGDLNIKIIDGLEFDGKASVNNNSTGARHYAMPPIEAAGPAYRASQESGSSNTWLVNGYFSYKKLFAGAHNFGATVGMEEYKTTYNGFGGGVNELPVQSYEWFNLSIGSDPRVTSSFSDEQMRSYFGRVNYDYLSRYYLTANFRADGSSRFRKGNRWGYFPSFSLAWRITEEPFMKNQKVFQNLKLRGGWGETGSQAVSTYATYNSMRSTGQYWGDTPYAAYHGRIGGNPNLKWETTRQFNIGLDFTTLNNRLNVTLDYYNKKTVDLLAPVDVTAYSGGAREEGNRSIISNVGSVRNRGFEFNIDYDVIRTKDWSYNTNLNGSFNTSKVLDLGDNTELYGDQIGGFSSSPFVIMPGERMGAIYGMKCLGIWQENEAEEAAKFSQAPGDYKYEDLNGDYAYGNEDKQIIGNGIPKFTFGWNNTVTWKNFQLNLLIEGALDRDIMNWSRLVMTERAGMSTCYTLREARDRWSTSNPNAKYSNYQSSTASASPTSDLFLENGNYVKFRNLSLSYLFSRKDFPKMPFDLRVSASVQNFWTITSYSGLDPETSNSEGNPDMNSAMDWFNYPNPMSFSFGLSIVY